MADLIIKVDSDGSCCGACTHITLGDEYYTFWVCSLFEDEYLGMRKEFPASKAVPRCALCLQAEKERTV